MVETRRHVRRDPVTRRSVDVIVIVTLVRVAPPPGQEVALVRGVEAFEDDVVHRSPAHRAAGVAGGCQYDTHADYYKVKPRATNLCTDRGGLAPVEGEDGAFAIRDGTGEIGRAHV